jgi:hypothetical protein
MIAPTSEPRQQRESTRRRRHPVGEIGADRFGGRVQSLRTVRLGAAAVAASFAASLSILGSATLAPAASSQPATARTVVAWETPPMTTALPQPTPRATLLAQAVANATADSTFADPATGSTAPVELAAKERVDGEASVAAREVSTAGLLSAMAQQTSDRSGSAATTSTSSA